MTPAHMTDVTQIVPALPPTVNGLGDYAFILARELRKYGTFSRFVIAGVVPARTSAFEVDDFPVQVVKEQSADALARALDAAENRTVLLHFVGYGYARWGLCAWLVNGLRQWKRRCRERRLITMFHELYASGPPWRMSFWSMPPQYQIARELAFASDEIVCGYALIERKLRRWGPNRTLQRMPVFSNVGELDEPPPLMDRQPVAVIFGGAGTRRRLYDRLHEQQHLLSRLGIERALDIGPPVEIPESLDGIPLCAMGVLSSSEISAIMTSAKVGVADYPLHVVAKSGILAAYHAHGLLCVNLSRVGRLVDDVVEGQHFVGPAHLKSGSFDAGSIAMQGHRWYRGHDCAHTAKYFSDIIRAGGAGS